MDIALIYFRIAFGLIRQTHYFCITRRDGGIGRHATLRW
jgi:hypothetical protein